MGMRKPTRCVVWITETIYVKGFVPGTRQAAKNTDS